MGGASLPNIGARKGQSPTTIFFGNLPDRLTLLTPGHNQAPGNSPNYNIDQVNACNFVNQFTIWNDSFDSLTANATVTLGAFTTAPDGTTNVAQKIVETTTTHSHAMSAGWLTSMGKLWFRFGVFVKAAERTRIALEINSHGTATLVTVFDVAGVQIGVAPVVTGKGVNWLVDTPIIKSFGNGWCACWQDVQINDGDFDSLVQMRVLLDAGSGTQAQNTTYSGDGSSGMYFWKACGFPRRACGLLNNVTYFNDWTSLAEIDVNNTLTPGAFFWYVKNTWPNPGFSSATSVASQFSIVGGTNLHIISGSGIGGSLDAVSMETAAWNGVAAGAGQFVSSARLPEGGWFPPMCYEVRFRFNVNIATPQHCSIWSRCLNNVLDDGTKKIALPSDENDWWEAGVQGQIGQQASLSDATGLPNNAGGNGASGGQLSLGGSYTGIILWQNAIPFVNNAICWWPAVNGRAYANLSGATSTNQQPDLNPGVWSPFSIVGQGFTTEHSSVGIDHSQFHVYSLLWLTVTDDENGAVFYLMDGGGCVYSYNVRPSRTQYGSSVGKTDGFASGYRITESLANTFFVGPGAQSGNFMEIDYHRMTQ